jgi:hypothetical protein
MVEMFGISGIFLLLDRYTQLGLLQTLRLKCWLCEASGVSCVVVVKERDWMCAVVL